MPDSPGVYLMKNQAGEIIYIGKSRSLKKRVKSYFVRRHDSLKTSLMVSAIENIEYIVTENEVEALILENNLIKKHRPRYNILLKDSKTHPYIRVTIKESFPKLEKVRKVIFKDGNLYFGPFPNEYDLTRIVDLLSRNFRLCTGKNVRPVEGKKVRPCLKYHLGLCQGVCQGEVSAAEYSVSVTKAVDVLAGRSDPDFCGLEKQLRQFAMQFRYEEAAELRDTLTALKRFFENQKVEFLKPVNVDIWGISEACDRIVFSVFFIRSGKLTGNRIIDILRNAGQTDEEILASVMSQFYEKNLIPADIYSRVCPDEIKPLLKILSERADRRVAFHVPRKGQYLKLLEMACNNALEVLRNLKSEGSEKIDESVIDLQNRLNLQVAPYRIECVDISHIQGVDPVASLVVSVNGRPRKGEYRLFHIKSARGGDDPASIAEITRRRFSRLIKEQSDLPDLFIVDGGITQVRAAEKELQDLGVHAALLGLAKREEILVDSSGNEFKLPFSSNGMKVIIKLRNEAHRFANTFQKKTHSRKLIRSALLNLPGVGPATIKKALWEFGSMANLSKVSADEIQKRCKIPAKTASLILKTLKDENNE